MISLFNNNFNSIAQINKNIEIILEKVNILNLEDCMFDLKTMLEYYDSLFLDFEKERLSKKVYEEVVEGFSGRLEETNKLVEFKKITYKDKRE